MADSPSSQYSIDGLDDLVANLPDSNGEFKQEEPSDEGFFDVDILIRKLEAYKASVEDVEAQIRRKRSINPREVSEVTAAARLKLRLGGRPAASSEMHDNSVLTTPIALVFPSSVSSHGSSSSETSYFDPVTPEEQEDIPVAVFASSTNRDTWKSSHSVVIPSDMGKTDDVSLKPIVSPRSPGRFVPEVKTSKPPTVKLLGSRSKISSPLASPAFAASDWLGVPRAIGSLTTSESGEIARKSIDEMSMCPPDEDRIRREIETYTIKDWIETEDVKQLEVIASSKEPGQVQIVPLDGSGDEDPRQPSNTGDSDHTFSQYKYGRTTFREKVGSLWHRRTKTDKIIALYFDMEASPKQKASRT